MPTFLIEFAERCGHLGAAASVEDRGHVERLVGQVQASFVPGPPRRRQVENTCEGQTVMPPARRRETDEVVDEPALRHQLRVEGSGAEDGQHRGERVEGQDVALHQPGSHIEPQLGS